MQRFVEYVRILAVGAIALWSVMVNAADIHESLKRPRGERMAFVNDYASDEDIERFQLNEVWDRYFPFSKGDHYHGRRPEFTVSREDDVFLMSLAHGHGEDGNRTSFLLRWKGMDIRADLSLVEGSSGRFDERPFFRVWDLNFIEIPRELLDQSDEIMRALKDAVRVRGYWGVRKQIPETVVKFNF